jgi:hypothetical protein
MPGVTLIKFQNPRARAVVQVVVFAVFVFLALRLFGDNSLLADVVGALVAAALFTAVVLWDTRRRARSNALARPAASEVPTAAARVGWIDRALAGKRYRRVRDVETRSARSTSE